MKFMNFFKIWPKSWHEGAPKKTKIPIFGTLRLSYTTFTKYAKIWSKSHLIIYDYAHHQTYHDPLRVYKKVRKINQKKWTFDAQKSPRGFDNNQIAWVFRSKNPSFLSMVLDANWRILKKATAAVGLPRKSYRRPRDNRDSRFQSWSRKMQNQNYIRTAAELPRHVFAQDAKHRKKLYEKCHTKISKNRIAD